MTIKPIKYEVQTYTLCDGWINCWSTDQCEENPEGMPSTFDTSQAAQAEIDALFEDVEEQIKSGERAPDHGYDREDFRIIEVDNFEGGTSK